MTQTPTGKVVSRTEQEVSKLPGSVLSKYTYLAVASEGEFRGIVDSVLKVSFDEK